MSASSACYILSICDGDYDNIIPDHEILPRQIYRTLEEAIASLKGFTTNFQGFVPILYGEVYPFEGTSLKKEVEQKGRGIYGWATMDSERVSICILKFNWASANK